MSISEIAIIGAGTMGNGIAQVAALAGLSVALEDVTAELASRGLANIEANLKRGVERGKVTGEEMQAALSRVHLTTDLADAAANADLVIEAIVERLDVKRELLAEIDRICRPETILASNTSSLSIASIAEATRRQ